MPATGSIAIDDTSFTPGCMPGGTLQPLGPISGSSTQSPCTGGQKACSDGKCLPAEKFCNFDYDCSDGSDEMT